MQTKSNNKTAIRNELWLLAALIALANLPLLTGGPSSALLFVPARVAAGEWWRIVTGFFVHVSGYHLLLDASAFLLLLESLRQFTRTRRMLTVAACAAGSLMVSLPVIGADGTLCGLSGIAHGLLAVLALHMAEESDQTLRRAGFAGFVIVVAKCICEAVSGGVLFANLHLGNVAAPVAVCHAGGVLGGVIMYTLSHIRALCSFSKLHRRCSTQVRAGGSRVLQAFDKIDSTCHSVAAKHGDGSTPSTFLTVSSLTPHRGGHAKRGWFGRWRMRRNFQKHVQV